MTHTIAALAELTVLLIALPAFWFLYRGLARLSQELADSVARLEALANRTPSRTGEVEVP